MSWCTLTSARWYGKKILPSTTPDNSIIFERRQTSLQPMSPKQNNLDDKQHYRKEEQCVFLIFWWTVPFKGLENSEHLSRWYYHSNKIIIIRTKSPTSQISCDILFRLSQNKKKKKTKAKDTISTNPGKEHAIIHQHLVKQWRQPVNFGIEGQFSLDPIHALIQ